MALYGYMTKSFKFMQSHPACTHDPSPLNHNNTSMMGKVILRIRFLMSRGRVWVNSWLRFITRVVRTAAGSLVTRVVWRWETVIFFWHGLIIIIIISTKFCYCNYTETQFVSPYSCSCSQWCWTKHCGRHIFSRFKYSCVAGYCNNYCWSIIVFVFVVRNWTSLVTCVALIMLFMKHEQKKCCWLYSGGGTIFSVVRCTLMQCLSNRAFESGQVNTWLVPPPLWQLPHCCSCAYMVYWNNMLLVWLKWRFHKKF